MALRRTLILMRNRLVATFATLALVFGVVSPTLANPKGVPNSNASGYWTEERRKNAISREFQFEVGATEGKLVPQARRGGSGGGTNLPQGSTIQWTDQSANEAKITGKVFFTMAGVDYVCSGSFVKEDSSNFDIIVTAGHCVWNNSKNPNQRGFATNWIFIPNYALVGRTNGLTATTLIAHPTFTSQSSFNTTATLFDFAFAVVSQSDIVENSKPSLVRSDSNSFWSSDGVAFGYPAVSPYTGQLLFRSSGRVVGDPNNGGRTWRIPSGMTGGASGGPWYSGYSSTSLGSTASVNSYKYSSDSQGMYGPKFNQSTLDLYTQATRGNCSGATTIVNCKQIP